MLFGFVVVICICILELWHSLVTVQQNICMPKNNVKQSCYDALHFLLVIRFHKVKQFLARIFCKVEVLAKQY